MTTSTRAQISNQLAYLREAVATAVGYTLTGDADADDAQLVDRLSECVERDAFLTTEVQKNGPLALDLMAARALLAELVDVDWCIGYELTEAMQARIDDIRTRAALLLDKATA